MNNAATTLTNVPADVAARHNLMHRAWRLANPACKPLGRDWKDPIRFYGTEATLRGTCKDMGFTLENVLEAIEYMTATKASVTCETIDGEEVLVVAAPGYRAGPAC
jgi:hypothetical protein